MYQTLKSIFDSLMNGKLVDLNPKNIQLVSDEAVRIINKPELNDYDQMNASLIISISQIVYNNTDRSILFLDDGVYDILLEKYKRYNENFQVGAPVIKFNQDGEAIKEELINPVTFLENSSDFIDNSLYYNDLTRMPPVDPNLYRDIDRNSGRVISKKNVNVPHMYPKLVGSLDKCKFTLDREAMERDVFNDENVKIFERDFLAKHLQMGLIDKETPFELIAELKYDGISVEADVTDRILSARSRGDANNDIAADLTPILGGYKFPYAAPIPEDEAFGMKFEAIITHINLDRMARLKDKSYKNSRNGIIGLFGSSDAYDYRDLITLVPLATSIEGIDRVTEIEFLNKYYNSGDDDHAPPDPDAPEPIPERKPEPLKDETPIGFWVDLAAAMRPELPRSLVGFFSATDNAPVKGMIRGDRLGLICANDFVAQMVDKPEVRNLAARKASVMLGRPITVKVVDRTARPEKSEKMEQLMAFGREHSDIIKIKNN